LLELPFLPELESDRSAKGNRYAWVTIEDGKWVNGGGKRLGTSLEEEGLAGRDEMKVGYLQLVLWAWQVAVGMV
jgi:hypothetical protein